MTLPTIQELFEVCRDAKSQIEPDMNEIDITIGWEPGGDWAVQLGCNEFTGSAYGYPYWAVSTVSRRDNCRLIAKDLQSQLSEYEIE